MRLKATVFITGMSVMILEILGSRLIAPFFGNSLFVWTSLIGVVLAFLSAGYYYGGRLADKEASMEQLGVIVFLAGLVVCFIPVSSTPILLLNRYLGLMWGSLVSSLVLLSAPSFLLGIVSPYAVKLETKKMGLLGRTAGNLYAISTVGSIVGTFMTGFVLIPHMGVKTVLYLLGVVLFATSFVVSGKRFLPVIFVGLVSIVFLIVFLTPQINALEPKRIIYSKDTEYFKLFVLDRDDDGTRNLFLDSGLQSAVFKDTYESAYPYPYFFQALFTLNPDIRDMLFLGNGAGVIQSKVNRERPHVRLDSVDIDYNVLDVAKKYFEMPENDNVVLHVGDARSFIRNTDNKYDAIILDVFTSHSSIPPHLVTVEVVGEISSRLRDEGYLGVNLIGSLEGKASPFITSYIKTVSEKFSCVHILPVKENLSATQNIILFAKNGGLCPTDSQVVDAIQKIPDNTIYNFSIYDWNMNADDIGLAKAVVLTDDYNPMEYLQLKT